MTEDVVIWHRKPEGLLNPEPHNACKNGPCSFEYRNSGGPSVILSFLAGVSCEKAKSALVSHWKAGWQQIQCSVAVFSFYVLEKSQREFFFFRKICELKEFNLVQVVKSCLVQSRIRICLTVDMEQFSMNRRDQGGFHAWLLLKSKPEFVCPLNLVHLIAKAFPKCESASKTCTWVWLLKVVSGQLQMNWCLLCSWWERHL